MGTRKPTHTPSLQTRSHVTQRPAHVFDVAEMSVCAPRVWTHLGGMHGGGLLAQVIEWASDRAVSL